jgi:surface antigen
MKFRGMLVPEWTDLETLPVSTPEIQQPSTDLVEFFDQSITAVRENLEREYLKQPPSFLWKEEQHTFAHDFPAHAERVTDGLLSSLSEYTGHIPNEALKEKARNSVVLVYKEARRGALLKSALRDASSQDLRTRQIEALHDIKAVEPQERSRLIRTAWSGVVYSLEAKDAAKTEDFLKVLNAVSFTDVNPIRSQLKSAVVGLIAMDRGRELLPHDFEGIKSVSEIVQNAGDAKNYEADLKIHRAVVTNIAERYIDSVTSEDLPHATQYKRLIEALGVELDIDLQSLQQSTGAPVELTNLSPDEVLEQITTLPDKSSRIRVEYDPMNNRAKVISRAVGLSVAASAIVATQMNPAAAASSAAHEIPKLVTSSLVEFSVPKSTPGQDIETAPVKAAPQIIQIDVKPRGETPFVSPASAGEQAAISIDMDSVVTPDIEPVSIDTVDSKLENVDELISFYLENNSTTEAYRLIAQKVETLYDVEAVNFPEFQSKLDKFIEKLNQEAATLQLTDEQQFDYNFKAIYARLFAEYPSLLSQMSIDDLLKGNEQFAAIVSDKWLDQEHGFGSVAGDNYTPEQRKAIEQVLASAMAGLLTDADKNTLLTQLDPTYKPPAAVENTPPVAPENPTPKKHHKPKHSKPHHQSGHEHLGVHDRYKDLLDLVSKFEGGKNYNAYFGHGGNTTVKFTNMSVGEVMHWQKNYVAKGSPSSAIGRYQFLHDTLSSLVKGYDIPLNTKFDKTLQDRLAVHLLEKRGLNEYLSGKINTKQFAHNLSMEWASLPKVLGSNPSASYYSDDGLNRSFVSVGKLLDAVESIMPDHSSGEMKGIPDDQGDRVEYFANKLELDKDSIRLSKSSAGIFHFILDERAAKKLGITDIYPESLKNSGKDSEVDKYGMYNRECVSYVAYRVGSDKFDSVLPHWGGGDNRPDVPGQQSGNANDWDENARGDGIRVDKKPAKGSVMQWNSNGSEHSFAGHVAYVEKVFEDGTLVVSQYNAGGTGEFSVEVISPQLLDLQKDQVNFLHLEDWNS